MKITKILILFLISYLSFCQTNVNIVGYGEILLGESKKTLISKIGNEFSQKKINGHKYLYYKNTEISLDEYDVIDEITIYLDSNITIDSFSIKKESKVDDIIKTFGDKWGYYGKKPLYLNYENGISFETEYILQDTISKNLSENKYFLSSKIISIIISESDENSLDTFKNYEYIDGVYIPKNLDDSFNELNKLIKRKDRNNFLKDNENEFLTSQHFALGKYIRNEWGLWKASRLYLWFKEKDITHPDVISSIILKYYYRKKNQLNFNLENEIIYYKKYWNKQ
jgi:hypothetical protein